MPFPPFCHVPRDAPQRGITHSARAVNLQIGQIPA
jgi:hypothetical protein